VTVKPRSLRSVRIASFRSPNQRSTPSETDSPDGRCSFGGGAPVATARSWANDGQDGIWPRAVVHASSSLTPRSMSAVYRDSSSAASSSTTSSKRSSGTSRRERCRRTCATKSRSGIFKSCGALDGGHEHAPRLALLRQLLAPGRGELVEAPSPLSRAFDPPAGDAALRVEAIEDRIQRRDVEYNSAVGALLDARGDVVAVPRLILELGEDE